MANLDETQRELIIPKNQSYPLPRTIKVLINTSDFLRPWRQSILTHLEKYLRRRKNQYYTKGKFSSNKIPKIF